MITVAIIRPQKIAIEDFLISTSRRDAISEPVHAPVPGSGIPTNSKSPRNSYLLIWSLLPIARFSIFIISPPKIYVFLSHLKICLINNRINGIGIIFPKIQMGIAFTIDILRSDAARSPPLSSRIGIMEIIKITISLEICCPRVFVNQFTKTSNIFLLIQINSL